MIEKLLVKKILEKPSGHDWSLQGFGMLRLYLSDEVRLHVWDSRYAVDDVSTVHTHPWDFRSLVVAGEIINRRFDEYETPGSEFRSLDGFRRQTIKCGEGGGLVGTPEDVWLRGGTPEVYLEGESYVQAAHEIHASLPRDGTVTIVTREFKEDTEHAYVYFEGEWVSAEPRRATLGEVITICRRSLERWFKDEPEAALCA